jgi:hypothetical protein
VNRGSSVVIRELSMVNDQWSVEEILSSKRPLALLVTIRAHYVNRESSVVNREWAVADGLFHSTINN